MNFRRPPALADWLLDRIGCTRRNAALAGDLLEEFRSGRSAAWYWRQTLVIIAHGLAKLWPYLLALATAYAVQFPITLALWSKASPPALHISGWMKFGVYLLACFAFSGLKRQVSRLVIGNPSPDLKWMYCAVETSTPRSRIMALAAYESFSLGLANYCICALIFPRLSRTELVSAELFWFVAWVFTPALLGGSAPAAEPMEQTQPCPAIPQSEPTLSVTLPRGRTIILERDNLAQSIFETADRDLIRIVFGQHKSLEVLRRAIWLGGFRSRSYIQGEAESFTPERLAALIDETARAKSILAVEHEPSRRVSFPRRLKFWFCGDSA